MISGGLVKDRITSSCCAAERLRKVGVSPDANPVVAGSVAPDGFA
jgi:hypothetical protein